MNIKLNKIYKSLLIVGCLFSTMPTVCVAEYFAASSSYDVCFTPGDDCAHKIIEEILRAKEQILVQAYGFSDFSIAEALAKAKRKGVDVRVILDKRQIKQQRKLIDFLKKNKVVLAIDSPAGGIAHNKTMIIDNLTVIGGSYNFTISAAKRNAENVIIIKDAWFAQKYVKNWYVRERKSVAYDES